MKGASGRKASKRTPKTKLPTADKLQNWHFMVVPAGATPDRLTGRPLVDGLDAVVEAGVDDHELLAWIARSNDMIVDPDDHGVLTYFADRRKARVVRVGGHDALRAGLGAVVITENLPSLPDHWAVGENEAPELAFRICELLVLAGRSDLELAWQTGNVAAWRYALALAQKRPLMAKLWYPQIPKDVVGRDRKAKVSAPTRR